MIIIKSLDEKRGIAVKAAFHVKYLSHTYKGKKGHHAKHVNLVQFYNS
jgi:hypothetical protein